MVKIRLTLFGRHKNPFYRIIAIDSRASRNSAYLALLGTYEPFLNKIKLNEEKILEFLKNGAKPSETVLAILKDNKIWEKYLALKSSHLAKAKKSSKHINHNKKQAAAKRKERKEKRAKALANAKANQQKAQEAAKAEQPAEQPKAEQEAK